MRATLFAALLAGLAATPAAHGTYMDVVLDPDADSSPFVVVEHLSMLIEYPPNGSLSEFMDGRHWNLDIEAGPDDPGVQHLMASLNDKMRSDGSGASVKNLTVSYSAQLDGGSSYTGVDFRIMLTGSISGYTATTEHGETLVDLGWRGLGTDESIVIGGVDVNIPLNVLRDHERVIYDLIQDEGFWDYQRLYDESHDPYDLALGAEEVKISSMRLINSDTVLDVPMAGWDTSHHEPLPEWGARNMFHPNTFAGAVGHAVTLWSVGTGLIIDKESPPGTVEWHLAATNSTHPAISGKISYDLWTKQSRDRATVAVIGGAELDVRDGVEVAVVEAAVAEAGKPEILPVAAIYVAAGLAATGVGLFAASRRRKGRREPSRDLINN